MSAMARITLKGDARDEESILKDAEGEGRFIGLFSMSIPFMVMHQIQIKVSPGESD